MINQATFDAILRRANEAVDKRYAEREAMRALMPGFHLAPDRARSLRPGVRRGEGAMTDARLIAAAPDLAAVADEAPIISKYHGTHGFDVERFIGDYEAWNVKRRAALAKARGES